jgi:hypothetical protein
MRAKSLISMGKSTYFDLQVTDSGNIVDHIATIKEFTPILIGGSGGGFAAIMQSKTIKRYRSAAAIIRRMN